MVDEIFGAGWFREANGHGTSLPNVGSVVLDVRRFVVALGLICSACAAGAGTVSIDTVSSTAATSLSTARSPAPLATTTTSTVTTTPTTEPPTTTTVIPSDERTLELVADLSGDLASKSVVASGTGFYFAQNMMYRHTISVFNADKELVATIPDTVDLAAFGFDYPSDNYKGAPVEAAFSPDGRYAYISNYRMYGPGFTVDAGDGCNKGQGDPSFVYRIDTQTDGVMAIDAVYGVGSVPKFLAVTPDGTKLLVSNWCTFDLSIIDLGTGKTLAAPELGRHPRGIAVTADSATAYVAVMGTSDIAVVSLADASVTKIEGVGRSPRHLILSPDGSTLYATLNGEGTVVKIDVATGEVTDRVRTGEAPRSMAMAVDGRSLYVVNYESDTMTKVRTSDFEVLQEFGTADKPIGITYDSLNDEVWVSAYSGIIHVYAEN
ncbi:MAG: YVTN family beta-propeller protein [Acidimicrobiales bacterium]|jgi:YVTN family beta-propeller protein